MADSTKPRGVALNNPGNIEHGDPWQGVTDDQPDPRFCKFKSPAWGFRAMAVILVNYQDRYKLNTITGVISRWAPPAENDTGAYIAAVVKDSGFATDEPIDFHNYNDAYRVIRAITIHEQGGFEGFFTKSQLDAGLEKAGLEGAPRGIGTTVVKGVAGVGAAAAAAAANDPSTVLATYNSVKPIVDVSPEFVKHAFWGVVVLAFFGIGIGELIRIKNRKG